MKRFNAFAFPENSPQVNLEAFSEFATNNMVDWLSPEAILGEGSMLSRRCPSHS